MTAYDVEREKNDQHTIGIQVKTGEGTTLTNMPAAVVVVEPASVTLPEMHAGDVYYGELTLTNHGLIRADDLRLQLPQDNQYYAYEMLSGVPENLDPKERITVPYRVTRLLDAPGEGDPSTGSGQASGGGVDCGYLYRCAFTFWKNTCANGQTSEQAVKQPCFHEWLTYCAGGGSASSSTWTWFQEGDDEIEDVIEEEDGEYRPWVSPRKPGTPSTNIQGAENACYPEAQGDECRSACLCEQLPTCQNTSTKTKSFVNNLTRDYQTEGPELMVTVPGGRLRVLTIYKNGHWLIGPARSGMDGLPREKTGLAFHQYGDATRGYVISAMIKDGNISYELPPENFALKTEYAADGTLLSQQYAYTREQIYLHKDTYKITPYDGGWRWRKKSGSWKQYDADGRWLASGTRRGTTMTVLYDPEGKVIGYGDRNGTQVIWFDYNADGRIEAVRDAEGRRISYTYDSQGRLWTARDEVLNEETTYAYDDQGRLKQVLKPGGRESNITYNDIGNVIAVTDEQGQGYLFDYDYDDYRDEYYTMITYPAGTIKEVWYDEKGNTKRVDIDGTTVQTITQDDNALITTNENGEKTRREYDEWNNLTKVVYPDGSERLYEYEHTYQRRTRFVDKDGAVTQYEYDDTGLLIQRTTDVGSDKERTYTYTYTEDEKVKTITILGDGTTPDAVTTYEYNDLGKEQTIMRPNGDTVEKTYYRGGPQHGKLHTLKSNEKIWEYTYDDEGNLLTISGPNPVTTP